MPVTHSHAAHPRPLSLWYSPEPGSLLVLLEHGNGLLFGQQKTSPGVHYIDLASLSRRVAFMHCRLWYIRKNFVLYNLCRRRQATFLAREVKKVMNKQAMAGAVKIQVGGATEPIFLSLTLQPVEVDSMVDLSLDCILLVEPTAPDGHVLVRFRPGETEGEYILDAQSCKVVEITTKN